jgi:hypothetical protein
MDVSKLQRQIFNYEKINVERPVKRRIHQMRFNGEWTQTSEFCSSNLRCCHIRHIVTFYVNTIGHQRFVSDGAYQKNIITFFKTL